MAKRQRNEQIFTECLSGRPYASLATTYGVSEARIEQIFIAEAKRRHAVIFARLERGQGFRARFLAALAEAAADAT